jgi:photosystem II stability/assembly factor-like uncharacterized protein
VAASAGGGIWTSDDNGRHWVVRTDDAADLAIGSVTDDPSQPEHLIAGTGEANQCGDCFAGDGILVSTDSGQTWSLQNPGGVFTGLHIAQVAIDPSDSRHEFAATDGGLYVTTDGGNSWAKPSDASYAPLDGRITAVVIDPTRPKTVYIGGGTAVVAKSTDGGVHWATANARITVPSPETEPFTALAVAPSRSSTLYASVGSFTEAVALYKSTNAGESWSRVHTAPDYTGFNYSYGAGSGDQGGYDNVLAVDPSDAKHVLAGGVALAETTNGGATWSNVDGQPFFGEGTNKIHPDQHALAFRSDGKVWIGDDGGVYLYTPPRGVVENANGNLNITQFYNGFNAVNGTVLAGSQDNASARSSSAMEASWIGIFEGDGGSSAITPNEPATQLFEVDGTLGITNDAFAFEAREITPPEFGLFTPPLLVLPNTSTPTEPTVFFGSGNLWRTTNPSAPTPAWTKVTNMTGLEPFREEGVSALSNPRTNPNVIYVGFTNGVVQLSTDGGLTFTSLPPVPSGETWVTGLSANPANPKQIVASMSYFPVRSELGLPHVFLYSYARSPASGTWSEITGNLPSFVANPNRPSGAVSRVVYDKGALVAATDGGVYATGAAAGSSTKWTRVGTGMPDVQVQDLDVESDGLYAVTHGRGAWRLPTP